MKDLQVLAQYLLWHDGGHEIRSTIPNRSRSPMNRFARSVTILCAGISACASPTAPATSLHAGTYLLTVVAERRSDGSGGCNEVGGVDSITSATVNTVVTLSADGTGFRGSAATVDSGTVGFVLSVATAAGTGRFPAQSQAPRSARSWWPDLGAPENSHLADRPTGPRASSALSKSPEWLQARSTEA